MDRQKDIPLLNSKNLYSENFWLQEDDMDGHSVCGGVAFLLPLLPQSVYNIGCGNSLSEAILLGNKCVFSLSFYLQIIPGLPLLFI